MGFFSEVNAFLSLIQNFKTQKENLKQETVADRFITLFEKHEIHRNQIPRFFGHKLTLDDVTNIHKLSQKLSHELLKEAANLFNVRIEWLEGADDEIYELNYTYKRPEDFKSFLKKLTKAESYQYHLKLVISPENHHDEDALLIIDEPISDFGEKRIYRHHLFAGWSYRYYKCRADIAACVGIADKLKIMITRTHHVDVNISKYCQGEGFISDLYALPTALKRISLFRKNPISFHPDELLTSPKKFVDDLDDGLWGERSALKRWLYYFDMGYIDSTYYSRSSYSEYLEHLE